MHEYPPPRTSVLNRPSFTGAVRIAVHAGRWPARSPTLHRCYPLGRPSQLCHPLSWSSLSLAWLPPTGSQGQCSAGEATGLATAVSTTLTSRNWMYCSTVRLTVSPLGVMKYGVVMFAGQSKSWKCLGRHGRAIVARSSPVSPRCIRPPKRGSLIGMLRGAGDLAFVAELARSLFQMLSGRAAP